MKILLSALSIAIISAISGCAVVPVGPNPYGYYYPYGSGYGSSVIIVPRGGYYGGHRGGGHRGGRR